MAEKRLIYADTLLGTIRDTADGLADCDQQNAAWALRKYAASDIMDTPTVDAVEVVRCKDCKFGVIPYGDELDGWIECSGIHGRPLFSRDGFCYLGERRTEDA